MPPVERFICRFAAEPPQADTPTGDWEATLQAEFLAACLRIDTEGEELGEAQDLRWFPDRTWSGRTYVPVTARTSTGLDVFGYVSYAPAADEGRAATDFEAVAEFTDAKAESHPEVRVDISWGGGGGWRGEGGRGAARTPLGSGKRRVGEG